jgi:hypothetical protein
MRRHARPVVGSLDGGGVLLQRNTREVVLGSAVLVLPGVVLDLIGTSLAFDRYQSLKHAVVSVPELLGGQAAATGVEQLVAYLGLIITSLSACLVGGYVASIAVRSRMGLPVTIRSGYRGLARRVPALLTAWLIGHSWVLLCGLVLLHVKGSQLAWVAVFCSPLLVVLIAVTLFVAPVIVIERLGPFTGLRRAWRLSRQNFSMLFGFVGASALLGVIVQYGIAYLPRLLQATGLVAFGRFGWLIEGVAGQLGRLISAPLIAAATALMYLEVRMKSEGMDLVLAADAAFRAAP